MTTMARPTCEAVPTSSPSSTVCSGNLGVPTQRLASTALTAFNDLVLRVATEHAPIAIEPRLVCTSSSDYANPIEPSVQGGQKIARAIASTVVGASTVRGARVVAG